jgi:multiple sugar transport system permease protein
MGSGHAWHDRHLGYVFVLPATLMLAAVLVFPAFITLRLSVTPAGGSGWQVTLANYQKALRDPVLLNTFRNTFAFVAWSMAGHFVLGLGLALALNQALPGQTFFRLVTLIPWTIPDVVAGILFRWVLNPIHGAMNPLIRMIVPSFPAEFQWLSTQPLPSRR